MLEFAEILLESRPHPFWRLIRQIGIERVVGVLPRSSSDWRGQNNEHPWEYTPLAMYQAQVEEAGLKLAVIEDNPPMDRIRLGLAGRDEELEDVVTLIEAMGKLGIPVWCYNWMPVLGWIRTSTHLSARGGAFVSGFDERLLTGAPLTDAGTVEAEQLWESLQWFLERICPVAETARVSLAMHPDDPPLGPIRGIARIMSTLDSFERLIELHPSPANKITFCQGNFTLMTDNVPAAIRRFGKQIAFVHFRDVRGTASKFVETFHEDGQTDMLECMRAYRDIDFKGVIRSDHVPTLEEDESDIPGYSHRGRLYAIGYMTGLREAVLKELAN